MWKLAGQHRERMLVARQLLLQRRQGRAHRGYVRLLLEYIGPRAHTRLVLALDHVQLLLFDRDDLLSDLDLLSCGGQADRADATLEVNVSTLASS